MTPLQKNALGTTVMSIETVEAINNINSGWNIKAIRRLCLSHERLRAELEEAEKLIDRSISNHLSILLERDMKKFLSRHERDPANKRKDG